MQIAKRFIFVLICLPLVMILALGLLSVALSVPILDALAARFYPMGDEWLA